MVALLLMVGLAVGKPAENRRYDLDGMLGRLSMGARCDGLRSRVRRRSDGDEEVIPLSLAIGQQLAAQLADRPA